MSAELIGRRRFLARTGTGLVLAGAASSALFSPRPAWAATAKVGEAAPGFTVNATNGSPVSLASYKGKIVVLEWTNHDCPYVRKHYDSGNMQGLQREATGQGVVWLTVISSVQGTQGYVTPPQADELTTSRKAAPTAVLLDTTGGTGKLYGATNTPAHVRGGQGGRARLRRSHRRPADVPPRRRAGREQLRPGRARRGRGRAAGEDAGHARLRMHRQVLLIACPA